MAEVIVRDDADLPVSPIHIHQDIHITNFSIIRMHELILSRNPFYCLIVILLFLLIQMVAYYSMSAYIKNYCENVISFLFIKPNSSSLITISIAIVVFHHGVYMKILMKQVLAFLLFLLFYF